MICIKVTLDDTAIEVFDQEGVVLQVNHVGNIFTGFFVSSIRLSVEPIGLVVTYNNPNVANDPNAIGVFDVSISVSYTSAGTTGICGK